MHGGLRVCNVLQCASVRCIENRWRIQLVCKQISTAQMPQKKVNKSDIIAYTNLQCGR